MKKNSSKKGSKVKDKAVIEGAKKDLIAAMAEYLSTYPQFIKAKVNILSSVCVSDFMNLLYYLSKDKPESKEQIRSLEFIKKFCRAAAVSEDNGGVIDVLAMRAFLAIVDDHVRSEKLIEESLKLEVRHYFKTINQVKSSDVEKADPLIEAEESNQLDQKKVGLEKFEEDFKKISNSYLHILVKVTKDVCEIHSHGEQQFINLKDGEKEKEYIIENEIASSLLTLMKEIIRSCAGILVDRIVLGLEKTPVKQLISLSYLVEALQNILVRYPILQRYVLTYNLAKIIRKIKNPWIRERFSIELKDNLTITFFQFFIRIVLFVDYKYFKQFMTDVCQDTYVPYNDKHIKPG